MKCDPCRGLMVVPGCCHYPEPASHRIIVEVELDVYAVTPEDDDIEEQIEEALKEGEYDIVSRTGWCDEARL